MDKAAKAEKRIKQICDQMGITPDGRKWLDTALDPFKDILQKPSGYPDRIMAPSVVQVVHSSKAIKAPVGVSGNWDCNIFLDHLWQTSNLRNTSQIQHNVYLEGNVASPTLPRGGCVVRGAASGSLLDIRTTYDNIPYVTDVFDTETSARIIAIGMEVHNTTSELYKQGSVITWAVSDEPTFQTAVPCRSDYAVRNNFVKDSVILVDAPETPAEAIDLPGSLQWDAAKGCYVVPRFIQEENEPQDLRPLIAVEHSEVGLAYTSLITSDATNVYFDGDPTNAMLPTGLAGAMFTGLSNQTELTVNLTYYVEQFPSIESNLRRLAGQGCPEDFAALELYTKIVRHMPTGVEVNDNFLGAFVAGIARVASMVMPYIPRVLSAISTGSEIVSSISNGLERDREIRNRSLPSNSTAIVPSRSVASPPRRTQPLEIDIKPSKGPEIKVIEQPKAVTSNVVVGRKTVNSRNHTVKNQRDKNYSRLSKYMKASNAGNTYIQ